MPRQSRIDYPGALHHVIGRGIERRFIFKEDYHKAEFYRRLADNLSRYDLQCYAWCIMGNHFHLLLQSGEDSIASFMRCLLTGYAVYYNRKTKRSGHLFQNRYKSVVCEKDEFLKLLVRYIHLNPIKANMIRYQDLRKYSWTGHREICLEEDGIIEKNEILSFFGSRKKESIQSYHEFVKDGIGIREDFEGGGLLRSGGGLKEVLKRKHNEREMYDERILGSGQFVESVVERLDEKDERKRSVKTVKDLLSKVSLYYDLPVQSILKTREIRVREARDIFLYMGKEYLGESITDLGGILGILPSSASDAIKRARRLKGREKIEAKVLM